MSPKIDYSSKAIDRRLRQLDELVELGLSLEKCRPLGSVEECRGRKDRRPASKDPKSK